LVDANVPLDVSPEDREWARWSEAALARAGDEGRPVINPIVRAGTRISGGEDDLLYNLAVADAFEARRTEERRRAAGGRAPRTRRRRRRTLADLAGAGAKAPP
jgi:hypothetical protein